MQKKLILAAIFCYVLAGCNTQDTSSTKEVKQYSATQLYNNENINGIAFDSD